MLVSRTPRARRQQRAPPSAGPTTAMATELAKTPRPERRAPLGPRRARPRRPARCTPGWTGPARAGRRRLGSCRGLARRIRQLVPTRSPLPSPVRPVAADLPKPRLLTHWLPVMAAVRPALAELEAVALIVGTGGSPVPIPEPWATPKPSATVSPATWSRRGRRPRLPGARRPGASCVSTGAARRCPRHGTPPGRLSVTTPRGPAPRRRCSWSSPPTPARSSTSARPASGA